MNSKLRFGIIGCGKIAPRHTAEIIRHGELVAVCDIVGEKADALGTQYGANIYYTIDELLNAGLQLDIICICTPNGLHAMHSIKALQSGHHVLCEKPLCITVEDGRKMNEAAIKAGRKLFVVKSTRYNPALVSLKEMLDGMGLGKLYSFQLNCFWNRPAAYYTNSWKGTKDMDGGTLFTQFSHYIDAMLWLLGDIRAVAGFRKNLAHSESIEFEDAGVAALEMASGVIGGLNWSVNTFQKNMEVSLTILAEKGSLRIGGEYMNKIEYQLTDQEPLKIPLTGSASDYGFYKGSMSNHDKIYDNLIRALQDSSHPFANAEDGMKTVEAIEKIYNSVSLS